MTMWKRLMETILQICSLVGCKAGSAAQMKLTRAGNWIALRGIQVAKGITYLSLWSQMDFLQCPSWRSRPSAQACGDPDNQSMADTQEKSPQFELTFSTSFPFLHDKTSLLFVLSEPIMRS